MSVNCKNANITLFLKTKKGLFNFYKMAYTPFVYNPQKESFQPIGNRRDGIDVVQGEKTGV